MANLGVPHIANTAKPQGENVLRRALSVVRENAHVLIYIYLIASMAVIELVLERYTLSRFQTEQTQDVADQASTLKAQIEGEILARSLQMRGMAAAITTAPNLSQAQFDEIATQVTGDDPVIRMIAAAPNLRIEHVHPLASNRALIGLDYTKYDHVMKIIQGARDSGNTVLDGPVNIGNGQLGLVLRTPIFVGASETGLRRFWGVMSVTLDHSIFLRKAGLTRAENALEIALRRPETTETQAALIHGDARLFETAAIRMKIALPQGAWELAARPLGGWDSFATERRQLRFWMLLGTVLALLIAAYFIEISRRKTSAEANLLNAINALPDGFALYDANDRLIMCNAPFRRSFEPSGRKLRAGMAFEDILKDGVKHGLYPQAEGQEEEWIKSRLNAHRSGRFEQEELLSDGTWLHSSERRTGDGWTVALQMDITALKEAQLSAEAANQAKTEFLNVVTHELRTPLTVVLGYNAFLADAAALPANQELARSLQDKAATAEERLQKQNALVDVVQRYASKMETSGRHLLNLIQETLDFAKIEEGKMTVSPEKLPVHQLISEVLDQFQQQADAKGLDLWAEAHDTVVLADETRVKQILFNLVGNAMKFTPSGSVSIRTEITDRHLQFKVCDTGHGIPAAEQGRVFESFHQADSSDLRKAGGTGLGLSISRKLVELHGGTMSLQSVEGRGSTFSFTLPLA